MHNVAVPTTVLDRVWSSYAGPSVECMSFEPPAPDAAKLLATWMSWEKGEETPGRVLADLKMGGLGKLLEYAVEAAQEV